MISYLKDCINKLFLLNIPYTENILQIVLLRLNSFYSAGNASFFQNFSYITIIATSGERMLGTNEIPPGKM